MSDAPWRVLPFSAETFGPELFSLCRAVPALDHLLCRLDALHDPVYPEDRVLRYFQRDLMLHGAFTLKLPHTDVALRSTSAVMLDNKATFFGVQGRPDLLLAAARVGFTHPLCAVVLPGQRTVVNINGATWNVDAAAAQRALSLFTAVGLDWSAPPVPAPTPLVVTGDANYAHHFWNQLGALNHLLQRRDTLTVLATHQPVAPIAEIFADHPGLTVTTANLEKLDPRTTLPVALGGRIVSRDVRDRILSVAASRASAEARQFLARCRDTSQKLLWLSLRVQGRAALNLFDALLAIAEPLLRRGDFSIVLDGYSRPNDYGGNRGYDRAAVERAVMQESMVAKMLVDELARCIGPDVREKIFVGVGIDLLDSIHLAAHCRAYFVHHGTIQHKIGYFTTVPGMAHANPAITITDPAAGHRHVTEDPGLVEYVDPALIDDVVAVGGARMQPGNAYRFNDISVLVRTFTEFLARQGLL